MRPQILTWIFQIHLKEKCLIVLREFRFYSEVTTWGQPTESRSFPWKVCLICLNFTLARFLGGPRRFSEFPPFHHWTLFKEKKKWKMKKMKNKKFLQLQQRWLRHSCPWACTMFWWDSCMQSIERKLKNKNKLQGIKKGKQTTTLPKNANIFVQSSRHHTNFSLTTGSNSEYEIHILVSISELDACAVPPCHYNCCIPGCQNN